MAIKKRLKRYGRKLIDVTADVLANVIYQKPVHDARRKQSDKLADTLKIERQKREARKKDNRYPRYPSNR